ncbi:hypothetical protein Tco_0488001 [Tanacetum coccineum]
MSEMRIYLCFDALYVKLSQTRIATFSLNVIFHHRRLVVAATTYFIWIERNNWLFKNSKRSPEDDHDLIMITGMSQMRVVQALLEVSVVFNHIPLYLNF